MLSSGLSFAVLVLEREPLAVDDLPAKFQSWVQDVGGFAVLGLALGLLAWWTRRSLPPVVRRQRPLAFRILFLIGCIGAGAAYAVLGAMLLPDWLASLAAPDGKNPASWFATPARQFLLTAGGACAILAAALPFLVDLARLRIRRVGALAILSFREAVRRKVYLVFCTLLLVLLFLDWFVPHKPENQLRAYVQVIYWVMTPMLLATAALLAAFSIPGDVRHQTIQTIVTKPVERFEIVLGRFLGYTWLMSLTLAIMVFVSWLYVWAVGVHPDAEAESYRARVPLYGELQFHGAKGRFQGELVGREWEYRRYIAGGPSSPQRAIWYFRELPSRLAERPFVPCEFAFDVFRTNKGVENKGVFCTFIFQTRNWSPEAHADYEREREQARGRSPGGDDETDHRLAKKYGYFEYRSKEIADFHSFRIDVPVGLFENAAQGSESQPSRREKAPAFAVILKCESPSQFVGVAKRDLYLVDAEGYFGLNFFKGAAGLWCRLCLVIGLAVACGTYLSGVISLISTLFLCLLGLITPFVVSVATGTNEGGGPAEAFYRLVNNQNVVTPLDQTPVVAIASKSDDAFRWFLRRFLNIVPDMDFYDLSGYVAEGFDISLLDMGLHLLMLFGYLLPWAVLAYYLMKSREIAS